MTTSHPKNSATDFMFADVFAGCGGFSLGLINAGWQGCFAIEKNHNAFETLKTNLIVGNREAFKWPTWLPMEATSTLDLLNGYKERLAGLKGKISLLVGGPPCQGFSMAGRRTHSDPRNSLTEEYIHIVRELLPRALLIENVKGFTLPFKKSGKGKNSEAPYSVKVTKLLESAGYKVFSELVNLSAYGVPQARTRFIIMAIRKDDPALDKLNGRTPFDILAESREQFLLMKNLPINRPVSVREAIHDLEVKGKELIENVDSAQKGFKQIRYVPNGSSKFIELMRMGVDGAPCSLRLPRHKPQTIRQFSTIITTCIKGKALSKEDRQRLGIKKHALTPLHGDLPSVTITTLPDDMIHYSEPRVLTVRENARIQTFPDWFKFTGNYTTGTVKRKSECPRYTQVGNAVPPLFSEAIGRVLKELIS